MPAEWFKRKVQGAGKFETVADALAGKASKLSTVALVHQQRVLGKLQSDSTATSKELESAKLSLMHLQVVYQALSY